MPCLHSNPVIPQTPSWDPSCTDQPFSGHFLAKLHYNRSDQHSNLLTGTLNTYKTRKEETRNHPMQKNVLFVVSLLLRKEEIVIS